MTNGPRERQRSAARSGALLAQMLVALALGAGLLAAATLSLVSALRANRMLAERAEGLEVVRTVWVVLEEELRSGRQGQDWALDADGVLELRAFRGFGRICALGSPSGWTVAYRGRRTPDPLRDSLLVLGTDGEWRSSGILDVRSASAPPECGLAEGETPLHLDWAAIGSAPVLVRLFERGSYHLENRAFRYRRGGGGRQPLTPERLAQASGFRAVDGELEVFLDLGEASRTGSYSWRTGELRTVW